MSKNDGLARVLPVFSAAFAIIYLIVEQNNWPMFTYHPRTGVWGWLHQPAAAANSPAMHWFGWLATSTIGAGVACIAALPLTRGREVPLWIGWPIPLAVMIAFVYLFRSFFV